jgi:pimeloyl-ACP methyl ester carboxylesterase
VDLALSTAGALVRTGGRLSPELGAAVALPFFARIARTRPVNAGAQDTMWAARRSTVRIPGLTRRGVDVVVYEWGAGDDVMVLAHGWDGRASQFAVLVRDLIAEGYRVVAFDAPAHGDTIARGSYLIDWLDILEAIRRRFGRLHTVVGHSFGGLATLVAAADGLPVDRVVTVAAPADADLLLQQFQAMLRFDDRTAAALRARFAEHYFPGHRDPFARLSPARRPLPRGVRLLAVHDEGDRVVPFGELTRITDANPAAEVVETRGLGHNRVLESDVFLDAVLEFVAEPVTVPEPAQAEAAAQFSRP